MSGSERLYLKHGWPGKSTFIKNYLTVWNVPEKYLTLGTPKRIYCNKNLIPSLIGAFENLLTAGLKIPKWDGCYNFRPIRGYEKRFDFLVSNGRYDEAAKYLSTHSYGMAIDIDAANNGLGFTYEQLIAKGKKPLSNEFIKCFTDSGWTAGANFRRSDRMHQEVS